MRILYYSPASSGGIAAYAHEQANALVSQGVEVTLLCTPHYPTGRGENYQVLPLLTELMPLSQPVHRVRKVSNYIYVTLKNYRGLARYIRKQKYRHVLFGSYSEYLAPLWSGAFRQLAERSVVFGAIVHDPLRSFILGPLWWHRWSGACAYSFLREAFVHESILLDTVKPMPHLRTSVVPYGVHSSPPAKESREIVRGSLNLPLDAKVMLSFGQLRDSKNLDLVIQAMARFPNLYLIVAGERASSKARPTAWYQTLAMNVGVADRCRWLVGYIESSDVGNLFAACDIVLTTYNGSFKSASSVLNTAACYRKPCLASSGQGPLRTAIEDYDLGYWVEPDNVNAIEEGIATWLDDPLHPQWDRYVAENSWGENAKKVLECLAYP